MSIYTVSIHRLGMTDNSFELRKGKFVFDGADKSVAQLMQAGFYIVLSWENVVYKHEMLITMACIIFVSACSIALFELLSAKTERAVELETQIENDRMIKVYNEELQAMYKELMEHQHDMKHQFCVLEELIARGEVTESQRYLDQLRESVLPVRRKV